MIIHLYAGCYNEATLLPYFFRHYSQFVDEFFMFDDDSIDGSAAIMTACGANVIPKQTGGRFNSIADTDFKNSAYKASRGKADWVIVVDVDEFLWHPDVLAVLRGYAAAGVMIPRIAGYQMVANRPPFGDGQIYDEIAHGFRDSHFMDKCVVFNPSIEINYELGAHECRPADGTQWSAKADLKLLHYHMLGEDYMLYRNQLKESRLSDTNKALGMGRRTTDRSEIEKMLVEAKRKAVRVVYDGIPSTAD